MRDMAQLLPTDKAKVLAECLGLLETLMADVAAGEVINVEMEDSGSHSTDGHVVPGIHIYASPVPDTVTNGIVQNVMTDPYAGAVDLPLFEQLPPAAQAAPLTPRRGVRRTRSESP